MLSLFLLMLETEEEKQTFSNLYNKYNNDMFRFALAFTKDQYEAETALSDSWTWVAQHLDRINYDDDIKQKRFLYAIAKHDVYDLIRKRNASDTLSLNEMLNTTNDSDIEDMIIGDDEYKRIVKKIYLLPDIYQNTLILFYVHNLSANEIADKEGVSLNTVRTRIKRGTHLLKEIIERD